MDRNVKWIKETLLARAGETITPELAEERARNIAQVLVYWAEPEEVEKLSAENAALREDKERIDYLDTNGLAGLHGACARVAICGNWRTAIDKARAALKGEGR